MSRQATPRRSYAMRFGIVVALAMITYVAAPYVCLWRLYRAVQTGDEATLAQVVDWDSVRQGLKQDIAEGIIGLPPSQALAANTLPAFGSGFVTGIAANVVDQQVTPQHLAEAVHDAQPEAAPDPAPGGSFGALEHAFFSSPTVFVVRIRLPNQDPDDAPLRVELGLRSTGWKVIRAWVPQDLMDDAKFHT